MKTSNSVLKQAVRAPKGQMMKTVMSAALGLAMLLGNATTWAADMCFFTEGGGAGVIVGKNFSFPGAGACKTFTGYLVGSDAPVSGAACGTSNNVDIRFNLNYSTSDGHFGISVFRIDRLYSDIDKAGYGYYTRAHAGYSGSWTTANFEVKTIPCPSPLILQ